MTQYDKQQPPLLSKLDSVPFSLSSSNESFMDGADVEDVGGLLGLGEGPASAEPKSVKAWVVKVSIIWFQSSVEIERA